MDNETAVRFASVDLAIVALASRLDERFQTLSRQVNSLSERVDGYVGDNHTHSSNHHGRASMIRQGSLTASAAALLAIIAQVLLRFVG